MRLFSKKAQSTAEYAILIGLVVGVLVVMQTYIKRGIQGRFKDATDSYVTSIDDDATNWALISNVTTPTLEDQWEFDKYSAQRTRETVTGTETTEAMSSGGQVTRDITQKTKQAVGDYQEYGYGTAPVEPEPDGD